MFEGFLKDLTIIFAVSTGVSILFHWIRLPAIVGFIVSGIIVGPYGFQLIADHERVSFFAEFGLIFLLFTIGVELSVGSLMRMKKYLFGGGFLQFFLVSIVAMLIALSFKVEFKKACLIGAIFSLSSTAIVLKALHQRREIATPHGNLSVGILIFQDLMVVPLMLLLPLFAGAGAQVVESGSLIHWGLKGFGVILIIFLGSRYVVPFLFKLIATQGGREVFLVSVVLLIFSSAWAAHEIGLSLALGAFIAGILISESPYGHQATADMVAWRDPLVAIFFVSIGMLLDLNYFFSNWATVLGATIVFMILKSILNALAGILIGVMRKASIVTGLMLSQVGEFSFVLVESAYRLNVFTANEYQFLLSVIVLSLMISPLLIHLSPQLAPRLMKTDFVGNFIERAIQGKLKTQQDQIEIKEVEDHVIIIGFGNNGRNLAAVLRAIGIPYRIIESNASILEDKNKEPIQFGDGGKTEILEGAGIYKARIVVIAINDPIWIQKITSSIRKLRPDIHMVVRFQYLNDLKRVLPHDMQEVIVAESETAKQIVKKVLDLYQVPQEEILQLVGQR